MKRNYSLQYDLQECTEDEVDVIEAKIKFYGGAIEYDPTHIRTLAAKFFKEENRNYAKKKVDAFLSYLNIDFRDKILIRAFADSVGNELPCQELMSR